MLPSLGTDRYIIQKGIPVLRMLVQGSEGLVDFGRTQSEPVAGPQVAWAKIISSWETGKDKATYNRLFKSGGLRGGNRDKLQLPEASALWSQGWLSWFQKTIWPLPAGTGVSGLERQKRVWTPSAAREETLERP